MQVWGGSPQRVQGRALASLALAATLLVCVVVFLRAPIRPLNEFDQPFYLGIADDLIHTGRFTNGFMFSKPGPDGERASGMRFAPLYPHLLAGFARIEPGLRGGMDCLVATAGKDSSCARSAPLARGVQLAELIGVFWLIWWFGLRIGGSQLSAWLALGLALITAPLLMRSVAYLMTEMTCLTLTTAAMAAGLRATEPRHAGRWAAACGALLALAALTRPAFLYLIPAVALGAALLGWRSARAIAGRLVAFLLTAALVLAPWIARNAVVMGHAALTFGYDSHTLVQRISFDRMSWHEYGLAYLCWLPDGTSLGRHFFGPGACDRFGWVAPNSFYILGVYQMLDETLVAAGGYSHHLSYLLHNYIFRMPIKHALVTVPLALRGAYIAHWWGFVLLFVCLGWTWRALRRGPSGFLVLALPAWFMLAFNAAVAVNQVRYNLMLIPAYAVAGGLALSVLVQWSRDRRSSTAARTPTAASP